MSNMSGANVANSASWRATFAPLMLRTRQYAREDFGRLVSLICSLTMSDVQACLYHFASIGQWAKDAIYKQGITNVEVAKKWALEANPSLGKSDAFEIMFPLYFAAALRE